MGRTCVRVRRCTAAPTRSSALNQHLHPRLTSEHGGQDFVLLLPHLLPLVSLFISLLIHNAIVRATPVGARGWLLLQRGLLLSGPVLLRLRHDSRQHGPVRLAACCRGASAV